VRDLENIVFEFAGKGPGKCGEEDANVSIKCAFGDKEAKNME